MNFRQTFNKWLYSIAFTGLKSFSNNNNRLILWCMKYFLCTLELWYEHSTPAFWLHNNLCEFIAIEHNFKKWFCTQKLVLNDRFKDFWYTKMNLSQIYILCNFEFWYSTELIIEKSIICSLQLAKKIFMHQIVLFSYMVLFSFAPYCYCSPNFARTKVFTLNLFAFQLSL